MKTQTLDCTEKFSEAWLSCMVMMAQGKGAATALTWSHCITALKVSTSAVLSYAAVMMVLRKDNKAAGILLMGTLTGVMSFEFVPSHFGPIWAEAVATAVCTSSLAFAVRAVRRGINN
jgi:hypothetical protein